MINLVFIGRKFYNESHTMMSYIYIDQSLYRYDYGKMQIALEEGESITIRQATGSELEYFERKLQELKNENS
jgi:hypothetical protein